MKLAAVVLAVAALGFAYVKHDGGAQKALPGYDQAVHTPAGPNRYLPANATGPLTPHDVEVRLEDDARQWALAHIHPVHCRRDRTKRSVFICIDAVNGRKAAYTVRGSEITKTSPQALPQPASP